MSCYFRIMKDVFETAGIEVTKENREAVNAAVHELLGTTYKDCPTTGRAFKAQVGTDPKARDAFARKLARKLKA